MSCWRLAFNGAEAVSPDTVRRFAGRFAPCGLRPEAVAPVYGLAEATVGLLFPPLGRVAPIDAVQREPFTRERRAVPAVPGDSGALRFVGCGRPLAGHSSNLHPEEIEEAVGRVEGVRKGCVAVFGSPDPATGTERLVVLAERRLAGSACRALYESGDVGAAPLAARRQVLRLAAGAVAPRLRQLGATVGRLLFGVHAMGLFWLLAPPVWLLTLLMPNPAAAWALGSRAARALFGLTSTTLTVRGLEYLPDGPCVLVSNHASYLDGVILVAVLPRPYAFVAKRELGEQFIAGRYLRRLGAEFVERFDVKRAVEGASAMAEALARGRSLLVFPEGTFVAARRAIASHTDDARA